MASKSKATERRQKVEALRKAQRAQEQRRTRLIIGVAVVIALGIVGAAAYPLYTAYRDNPVNKAWNELGVPLASASCDPVIEDPVSGGSDHRDEGALQYETVPPSSGPHRSQPEAFSRKFYSPADAPEIERLVHNLEHGYTIFWYDQGIPEAQREVVEDIAQKVSKDESVQQAVQGKFIAVPWDPQRGAFPDGKRFALSHWGAEQGYRQFCGQLSAEAVRDFVTAHPASDSPESAAG